MSYVVFYTEKVPATKNIIAAIKSKGRDVQAIQIDIKENRGYISKYQIKLVPTILSPDGKKIEGNYCAKYVNSMQNQIDGNGSSVSMFSSTKENIRIDTPQSDELARMNSFTIPNGGLMGNAITSLQENPVAGSSSGGIDERLAKLTRDRETM